MSFLMGIALLPMEPQASISHNGECTIYDYTVREKYSDALSYLQMLGIVSECEPSANVTRGEAVCYIIKSLGLSDMAMSEGSMYTYEEKMAMVAHRNGLLAGSKPSEWNLDSPTTGAQLSKMFVVALGYEIAVDKEKAYPTEYIKYVQSLGLTKGMTKFNSDSTVLMSDFIIMLSNAMKTEVMEIASFSTHDIKYKKSERATLENVYLSMEDMKLARGIVMSDYYNSIVSGEKNEYSRIRINDTIYSCESEKYIGYVGKSIEFACSDEDFEEGRKIVGMRIDKNNIVYEFAANHDAYFKNGNIYYKNKKEKEDYVSISQDAIYVVNNQLLSSYNPYGFDFSGCRLKLIDNTGDKKCDIVFISRSESVIVNYVKNNTIYFSYGSLYSKNVLEIKDLEDETVLLIHDIAGNLKQLSDIGEGNAISIIASEDLKYIEIILLPEPIEGKFEEYDSDNGTIMANGVLYRLKIAADDFSLGNTYNFRVNENNEIFYVESVMPDCAYIVAKGIKNGFRSNVEIQVYDNKNGIQIFGVADRLKVEDISYRKRDDIYSAIITDTLAYITLNNNNEIKKIEYLNEYGENAKRIYRKDSQGFNDLEQAASRPFRFNDNTEFFYIPESRDEVDFGVNVPLKNKDEYKTQAFEYDEDTGFVKAVVVEVDTDMRTDNNLTYSSDVAIVKSIRVVLDSEDQWVYSIEGYNDGEPFVYTSGHYDDVFALCAKLKPGDVIRYIVNYNNEIVRVKRIASLENTVEFFHDGKDTTDEQFFGQVINLKKNILTNYDEYLCHEMNVSTTLSYSNLAFMRFYAVLENPRDSDCQFSNYYCYDRETKEVSVASIDDIITYEMAGDAASKVFVQRSKSEVQCIVIVKD